MKKTGMLIMAGMAACTGCTTITLEGYTLRQTQSSGEGRARLVMKCLATVAANPDAVPPYSLYAAGVTTVTDSVTLNENSSWAPLKLTLETLGLTALKIPKGQWTMDPAAEYEQLAAMHAACLWAIGGPEAAWRAYPTGILGDPREYLDGKPHFGVEKRLMKTRPGWIHCGLLTDVPACALYKAHKGHTWVWVMPEDSESFAQFTLVLQDIATLDPGIIASPPLLVRLTANQVTKLPDLTTENPNKKNVTIRWTEVRAVKREYREVIEKAIQDGMDTDKGGKVNLTRAQWMAYTEPWPGMRSSAATSPTSATAAVATMPNPSSPTGVLLTTPNSGGPGQSPAPRFSIGPPQASEE